MSKKNQHVVPHNGKWAVKGVGNSKYTSLFDLQKSAIDRATEIAKNNQSEVVIHNRKGQIRDSNSYGDDPFPPKG